MAEGVDTDEAAVAAREEAERRGRWMFRVVTGIFFILLTASLYFAREFFMPVVLAVLLALTFSPLNRWFMRRGVPSGLSAIAIVFTVLIGLGALFYGLSGPVSTLISDAPQIARKIDLRLHNVNSPLDKINKASKQVEKAASSDDNAIQEVTIKQPGILSRATGNMVSVITTIAVSTVLTLFLLASGGMFYEKIIQSFDTLSDKKRALKIAHDVEREISRYLFTIFLINTMLGLCVGVVLWLLGFPNALLFGVIAAVLNFLPYIGAFTGIVTVGLLAVTHYQTIGAVLLPPAAYFALAVVEGQFVTPTVVGRRLEINAVAVFLAVAFWGWLWGVAGALIAVPILVFVKVFCDHFERLRGLGNFLAMEGVEPRDPDQRREPTEKGRGSREPSSSG